jgi:hypothetical protein
LQKQPLEVKDFSGGLTDHNKLGDPKRYIFADNLLVNNDKRLVSRHGSTFYDTDGNHVLPGTVPSRVSKFLSYDSDKELLVNRGESIYYLDDTPAWALITGPDSNQAVSGADTNHALSWSEWRKHVYLTSDGVGKPSFIYKDEANDYQVRTAGMPALNAQPTHTEATLLAECITLANALRSAMLAHIADTNLHDVEDKWSKGYFSAVSWTVADAEYPGPIPAVTPHGAATTEATLYTLVEALSLAYEHHGFDIENETYHQAERDFIEDANYVPPKGPFKLLTNNTAPSTGTTAEKLTTAAAQLDEIYQRWYWHRFGLRAHKDTSKTTTLDFYNDVNYHPVLAAKIGVVDLVGVPKITPNYDDFYNYVNYLKNMYNEHVQSVSHSQPTIDTGVQRNYVGLPDCDDLDLAYLIIYWVRMKYGWTHFKDANIKEHINFTCDTVAGSADITDVKDPAAAAITIPPGKWVVFDSGNNLFTDFSWGAEVLVSGSGTATLSKRVNLTDGDTPSQYSGSIYHMSKDETILGDDKSLSIGAFLELEGFTLPDDQKILPEPKASLTGENQNLPTSLGGWLDYAAQAFQAIYNHAYDFNAHQIYDIPHAYLSGLGYNFFKPNIATYGYAAHYTHTYLNSDGIEFEQSGPPVFIGPIETCVSEPAGKQMETGIDTSFLDTHFTLGGNLKYLDVAGATLFPYTETSVIATTPVAISMLPELVNDNQSNYTTEGDVTTNDYTTIDLFRTSNTGTTYFKLGEVENATTTYSDVVHDTETNGREIPLTSGRTVLYTTGGLVAFDQPPECKYVHIVNNIAYYGYIVDTGQTLSTRILQSLPDRPYTAPATFSDDLEDEVMGITSSRSTVIAFGKSSIYRMLGGINNLGQGELTHESISDRVGLVSTNSIVQTEIGVFFAGTDGFYYTDGFQLIKISIDLDASYAKLIQNDVQKSRITGAYNALTRVIWWGVQADPYGTDCDETWQFHLNYGVKPAGVFTKSKNGRHFNPSALMFLEDGEMLRGHSMGYIFKHSKWLRSDPKVPDVINGDDYDLAIGSWPTIHLPWRYQSCALDLGSIAVGQWVTRFKLLGDNAGNASIHVNGISDGLDDSRNKKAMGPIRYSKNLVWGNPKVEWDDATVQWQGKGKLDAKRRFSGNMRSQLKAVEMVPAYIGVYRYDDYHEGAYATLTGTDAVLSPGFDTDSLAVWPLDVVGMFLTVDYDDYVLEYEITSVSGASLEFLDAASDSVDGVYKWVIRGYPKNAGFNLLGYVMQFSQFGERGDASTGPSGEGENS